MQNLLRVSAGVLVVAVLGLTFLPSATPKTESGTAQAAAAPFGLEERTPWTTSHIVGSPEPPPPYETRNAFPKLKFKNPVTMTVEPGTGRIYICEQQSKMYSFLPDRDCAKADLAIDLRKEVQTLKQTKDAAKVGELYGLAFHPKFSENRYCYVCYTVSPPYWGQLPEGTRLSRFTVTDTMPPRLDAASEQVLLSWLGGGHNGGCLAFGPDDCLYISTGDGGFPNPPDMHHTGQKISDLTASILRIDVDHEQKDADGKTRPYTIPKDNPFLSVPDARGEVWAFGLRNPWKISFDRGSGDLWAGDVGWELWELAQRIVRGGNYGWSVTEGLQPVYPDEKPGPSPILPPTIAVPHTEGASITGGYVYRGKRFPDLVGSYIFGDWESRRLWGAKYEGDKVEPYHEISLPGPRVVAFGEDNDGELYILDYDQGTIHELVPNTTTAQQGEFPRKLSETGLFADLVAHQPSAGVIPFSIQAEQWNDYATAERFLALPDKSTVVIHPEPTEVPGSMFRELFTFPKDGVLAKTISLEMTAGDPASRKRLETQILHFDGRYWRGYTYAWNDAQTDATLVAATGQDRKLTVKDAAAPGGVREQNWHFASRNECLMCHNPWAGFRLAFTVPQLNRDQAYGGRFDNQIRTLEHIGAIQFELPKPPEDEPDAVVGLKPRGRFANPYDTSADVSARARAWLHVNCSHCHQFGAGGTADIELREEIPVEQTKTLEVAPKQGTLGIANAQILVPGDPYRSALYLRVSKLGRGRMPHIGSDFVDEPGVKLMHDWIRQLPVHKDDIATVERLRGLDEQANLDREKRETKQRLKQLSFDVAHDDEREVPTDEDRATAAVRMAKERAGGVENRAKDRADTIRSLLSSPTTALILVRTFDTRPLPESIQRQVLDAAMLHSDSQIRDLFERYVTPDRRVARLGPTINAEALLKVPGDLGRGRELYLNTTGVQCKNCHRVGDVGGTVGPPLDQIGKKYNRAQMLEHIVDPSKLVEPKYTTYLLETTDGKTYTGQLVERTGDEVVLKDVESKEIRVPTSDVEKLITQTRSLMPDQQLRDMTAQQAADLLTYLDSLK